MMKNPRVVVFLILSLGANAVVAQDWPQWRGANRDAKAPDFNAPKTWPNELIQKWKVAVGDGVATPALVGDKVYVFTREEGNEVLRCLNAADGKELWQDKYESLGASGPAQSFSGPRSSPAVAKGKVVTLGVRGMLSCLDASTGKVLWRKDDFRAYPSFHPSSSPIIVDGLCIAQLGGRENGSVVAYNLEDGAEKWRWSGSSPAYASPVLMPFGGTKLIIAQTESKLVAINAADGKSAWESEGAAPGGDRGRGEPSAAGPRPGGPPGPGGPGGGGRGGGRDYKAATPIVDGQTIIIAGRGMKALKLQQDGGKYAAKELWSNPDVAVQFNTPVLKDGLLYGLTQNNQLFCMQAKDGTTAWTAPFPGSASAGEGRAALDNITSRTAVFGQPAQPADPPREGERPRRPGGPGGPGGRRGGGGGGGYGSIVDAGSVLLALTPVGQLIAFEPNNKEFKQVASYKVASGQTHAYPVASGNRIFIKDKDTLTLWTTKN